MSARSMVCTTAVVLLAAASLSAAPQAGEELKAVFANRDVGAVEKLVSAAKMDAAAVLVHEKAKEFTGRDRWKAIFRFVRDEVKTEVYPGLLRGARGTLLSLAGNVKDKALLLHELLRFSRVPCRYATAPAPPALRAKIIAAMFDPDAKPDAKLLKKIPAGRAKDLARPTKDPKRLAELAEHVWVQVRDGAKWIDLDPSLKENQAGAAPVKPQRTPRNLPANWNQRLEIRLTVLVRKSDGTQQSQVCLQQALNAYEPIGAPLVLLHKPEGDAVKPILLWGRRKAEGKPFDLNGLTAGGRRPGGFPDIFGRTKPAPAQKRDTTLVAEMIEVTSKAPGFGDRGVKRFLLDLRSGKAEPQVLADLSRRVTNLAVLPGAVRDAALQRSLFMATDAHRTKSKEMRELKQRLAAGDAEGAEQLYSKQLVPALMDALPWALQAAAETVALSADEATERINAATCTRTFRHRPRVMLATWDADRGRLDFDLGLRACRTLVAPSRPAALGAGAQIAASGAALTAEMQLADLVDTRMAVSAAGILKEAKKKRIPLLVLGPRDAAKVDRLPVSAATRTLIKEQLAAGWAVTAMTRPLKREGRDDYAWYAVDPAEHILMAFGPEGGDQVYMELLGSAYCHRFLDWPTSIMVAFDSYLISYAGHMIRLADTQWTFSHTHASARFEALGWIKNSFVNAAGGGADNYAQYLIGVALGEAFLAYAFAGTW